MSRCEPARRHFTARAATMGGLNARCHSDAHTAAAAAAVCIALRFCFTALAAPGGVAGKPAEWRQDAELFQRWVRGQVRACSGQPVCLLQAGLQHGCAAQSGTQPCMQLRSNLCCFPLYCARLLALLPADGAALCGCLHARAGCHWLHQQPGAPERGQPACQGAQLQETCGWGWQAAVPPLCGCSCCVAARRTAPHAHQLCAASLVLSSLPGCLQALGLDWRLGAEYFACQLIDHDWAVNLGNWSYNAGGCWWWLLAALEWCWAIAAGSCCRVRAAGSSPPPSPSRPPVCAGTGNDPRDRQFKTVTQGLRYDPQALLIRSWVPQLAALQTAELAHQPWAATPEALAAAGVRLGDSPAAAEGRGERQAQEGQQRAPEGAQEAAAAAAAAACGGWYPLPVVDPASQTGKGPKQRQQQAPSAQPRRQQR